MTDRQPVLSRRPPASVRQALRREVGFRCPIANCGSPYLTLHHFDPPWRLRQHHTAAGMIALCLKHAAKADQGYYPDDFLRELKREGVGRAESVQGEFDYLRRDLLVIVGSNAYYNVETILQVADERAIYFNRDDSGCLLLNFKLLGAAGQPRAWMEDNVWAVPPGAENVDCPTRGRYLEVRFSNGDHFRIEYTEVPNAEEYIRKYAKHDSLLDEIVFPLTVAEFWEKSSAAGIELGRRATRIGTNSIQDGTFSRCPVGIMVDAATSGPPPPRELSGANLRAITAALDAFNENNA